MIARNHHLPNNKGFTIVELMIALSVLSIVLVMATVIMIGIGTLYSKGVTGANLQNTARTIVADVSAGLQFSGTAPSCNLNYTPSASATFDNSTTCYSAESGSGSGAVYALCIGTTRYSYVLNRELGTDSNGTVTNHVLWRDTVNNAGPCAAIVPLTFSQPAPPSNNGYEMVPPHMRLTRFEVYQTSPDVYSMRIWLAYGDSDLLQTFTGDLPGYYVCSGDIGTQYCAVSQITTAVTGRVY